MNRIPHILIVDNCSFRIERLHEFLGSRAFALEAVQGDGGAWEKLVAAPGCYDVIILGRFSGREGGAQLLSRIRADEAMRGIPVIRQTVAASRVEMLEGICAGALYHLPEPFEAELLNWVLETALTDRKRHRSLHEAHIMAGPTFERLGEGRFRFRTLEDARDLAAMLARACPNPSRAMIGLSELLINAVEHGNLGITYEQKTHLLEEQAWEEEIARRLVDPRYAERQVEVRYRRNAHAVEVVITDEGEGFDWLRYMEMTPERAFDQHGRGIAMSRALSFDDIEYRGKGNEVVVRIGIEVAA